MRGVRLALAARGATLKDIRAQIPDEADLHRHVLQDVLARLDRGFPAGFCRVQAGATPGSPRFTGRDRSHRFTDKAVGNGARLDNGWLVLSTIGRVAVRWSRPLEGPPQRVTIVAEADGW